MKNVLSIVSYPFLPAKIGGQKAIALFYSYFSKQVNLLCITTKNNDSSEAKGYTVLPVLSNSKLRYINIFYLFPLRKLIRQQSISTILIEHPYYSWLAILLSKTTNTTYIIRSHNIESLRFKEMGKWWWRILWQYEKIGHRLASHNFFITEEDKDFAIANFKLSPEKCTTITYGFELTNKPTIEEKKIAREFLCKTHNISPEKKILLFNGALDYAPNAQAIDAIIEQIIPRLNKQSFSYKIIICGRNLPERFNGLKNIPEIIFAGFVDDVSIYFKGADIFINPVIEGGGIKTKLVEAIGANLSAVSTRRGAIGIPTSVTQNKLIIVDDNNWDAFTSEIIATDINLPTPESFYEYFYWESIAKKALSVL
jgi:hypothetical protein